ncbi:MAG: hypothetical protein K2X91_03680 [Thermoleophilia bacterium]|nr:hypothetical protein [Thermoleophilia bacterium]
MTKTRINPALKGEATFRDLKDAGRDGLALADCAFEARPPAGAKARATPPPPSRVVVTLGREGGRWKVERVRVEPPAP